MVVGSSSFAAISPNPYGGTVAFSETAGPAVPDLACGSLPIYSFNGTAICGFDPTQAGTYTFQAVYSGYGDYQSSTSSATVTVSAGPIATTTTVTVSSPVELGGPVDRDGDGESDT